MKIQSLKYKNGITNWELSNLIFQEDLTLLVGISGAGKTRILNAIYNLKGIVSGYSLNGVSWDIKFIGENNQIYRWLGEFEILKDSELLFKNDLKEEEESNEEKPKLLSEYLYCNSEIIFSKENSVIKFEGKDIPKISPYRSAINLFLDDEKIKPAYLSLKNIYQIDYYTEFEDCIRCSGCKTGFVEKDKKKLLEKIKNQTGHVLGKLLICYMHLPDIFNEIKNDFMSIFPQVTDIRFFSEIENSDRYILQIKENNTDWISHYQISSGMFKTLVNITELKLFPENSVILIDELENSLGLNCINHVAESFLRKENLQFIITSHHPYIINVIPMSSWKIITRKSSLVITKNAEELNLGKSKHEAFKQLINLTDYYQGIL
ncbi:MAG: hypothetical protein A2086_03200 [Spirochaetes bacterium GWD1_27_9]|nr:MAG: hypothetical protein A2Z98_12875 [Spirochaetes bacterium GWB1_27_13]OHD20691.1 MAG: hypothetical protein A2Y34_14160 [Spirochaetes bacterium GWC1_27_15]OHD38704.1 MAG: hypothetical protein A2086_03200 [Spirochaetes bacterium GWD1_27_9]